MFCNGLVLHRFQCLRGFGEWLDSIRDFSTHLQSLNLDLSAFACLAALVLLTGEDSESILRGKQIEKQKKEAPNCMCSFCLNSSPHVHHIFLREELCLCVIRCDSDQVDTSTNVSPTLKDAHVHVCSHTSPVETKEPDTQKHLLHLPHTWLSNQCASERD